MQRYNKDKRAAQRARTRKIKIYDTCDTQNKVQQVRIRIKYDGYNRTKYDTYNAINTHTNKAQRYIRITNAINDIFPAINAPHNAHTHAANAQYKAFIPSEPIVPYTPPEHMMDEYKFTHTDIRRVKCLIFNAHDKLIYGGIFKRTIEIRGKDVQVTLERNKRTAQVRIYIPTMKEIYGKTIQEIRAHDIEFYHI